MQTVWNMQRRLRRALHSLMTLCTTWRHKASKPLSRLTHSCPHKNKLVAWTNNNRNNNFLHCLENPTIVAYNIFTRFTVISMMSHRFIIHSDQRSCYWGQDLCTPSPAMTSCRSYKSVLHKQTKLQKTKQTLSFFPSLLNQSSNFYVTYNWWFQ